ncbi:hypothetical protein M271_20775 [Streptomyces rapamycinicus NRRL 5491]|nr:hypothetical protein M271_20775 [Streptomyces rapamycinicus NRRL 5491]
MSAGARFGAVEHRHHQRVAALLVEALSDDADLVLVVPERIRPELDERMRHSREEAP